MARGLIAGCTDYSFQPISEVFNDMEKDIEYIQRQLNFVKKHFNIANANNYWEKSVPDDFIYCYLKTNDFLETTKKELSQILSETEKEIKLHHIKQLQHLGKTARDFNICIGEVWNQRYAEKDYGNKQFDSVEHIYSLLRDSVASLMDLMNYATRLQTFIGSSKENISNQKIIFLSSSPSGADRLRVDTEGRVIEEIIKSANKRSSISFQQKTAIKYETLSQVLLEEKPTILHFSGHSSSNFIVVDDNAGNMERISIESLNFLIASIKENIRIIILNCCHSSQQAQLISVNNIYTIGMNGSIVDEAAIDFSKGFYQAISAGKDMVTAFNVGKALFGNKDSISKPELWLNNNRIYLTPAST